MIVNMDAEARASLRHYLSAALIFPESLSVEDTKDAVYERTLAAFDEWFTFVDSRQENR